MKLTVLVLSAFVFFSQFSQAQQLDPVLDKFAAVYEQELGTTKGCEWPEESTFRVCSEALKNEGNAPYILHHGRVTDKTVVLFHGLSDSPFFFKTIAAALFEQGSNVVVALLPGHGKKEADTDMQDPQLAARWSEHLSQVMALSAGLGDEMYIGGFSTGGVLAAQYVLNNPKKAKGLLLFSGALALESKVESMANIWGMKWLAKVLDGDYQSIGRNPYKYPSVAAYSAMQLTDVIFDVRELLDQKGGIDIPIFSAHSAADATTPITGVRNLIAVNKNKSILFEIPLELDVCHANVVVSQTQLIEMNFDKTGLEDFQPCDVPGANPMHSEMLVALLAFMQAD